MAAHAGPEQMWSEMQRAGYWFAGGAKHCQRIYRSCHKCFRSKRPRQFLQGLQSSRRFLRWGDCVSWDCQVFGKGGKSNNGMTACLVFLDEFDGWVDLVPLPNYEATTVARALFA
jgi:hypothetical protein